MSRRPRSQQIESYHRYAYGKTEEYAGRAVKTTGRVVETSGSAIQNTSRAGRLAGNTVRVSGKAVSYAGKAAAPVGQALDAGGAATRQAGSALIQSGTLATGTVLGSIVGVPMMLLGAAAVVGGTGAQGAGKGAKVGGKAADKVGKVAETAGRKTADVSKRTQRAGKDLKKKGKRVRQKGERIEESGNQKQGEAKKASTLVGGAARLAYKTGRDATKGPVGWAKIAGRTTAGTAKLPFRAASKLWGGSGPRVGGVRAAVGLLGVMALMMMTLGGGAGSIAAAAETDGTTEEVGVDMLDAIQGLERTVWGDPVIPWELTLAVSAITTDYGKEGPYPSDPGVRGREGVDDDSYMEGSSRFPYVNPPIKPVDTDPQEWWWGGRGQYLFNPTWIDALPTWSDVYGLDCLGSPISQPYSPTAADIAGDVRVDDIDPEDDAPTTPITVVINPNDLPDDEGLDEDGVRDREANNDAEASPDQSHLRPDTPADTTASTTTTSTSTTTTTSTTVRPAVPAADSASCAEVYERLGINPNDSSEGENRSALTDFPVPQIVQFDPQHSEVAAWVMSAALRVGIAEKFGSDGYLQYDQIEKLAQFYDNDGTPTQDRDNVNSTPGLYPYEIEDYSTVEDPLTYRELSEYRAGGIGGFVWADVLDDIIYREYACPSWRWLGATPPSPVPDPPGESDVIAIPVDCPPPVYFELVPAQPAFCDEDGNCTEEQPAVMALAPLPPLPPLGMQIVGVAQGLAQHDLYDPAGFVSGLISSGLWQIGDINPVAMEAYNNAIAMKGNFPDLASCNVDVFILATIGKIESQHGTINGAVPQPNGDVTPPIRSRVGAMGPMQFMPGTWPAYASDGNNDNVMDPDNFFDAAVASMKFACKNTWRGGTTNDLSTVDGRRNMVIAYNCGPACRNPDNPETAAYVAKFETQYQNYKAAGMLVGGGGNADCKAVAAGAGVPIFETTLVPAVTGPAIRVHQCLATSLTALMSQARTLGVPLGGWGWRDPADQIRLRMQNCGTSDYAIYQMPAGQCRPPTARPGTSMHERGVAVDFTCNGSGIPTRSGPCWNFLVAHGAAYGFLNLPSEPWHWSVTGG